MINLEFSPPKPLPKQPKQRNASPEDDEVCRPVLVLKSFQKAPHLSFGKVKLGCTRTLDLFIQNPLEGDQLVRVEKFPADKGFSIEKDEFSLGPREEIAVQIRWTPDKVANYRETVTFKSSTGCKTSVYLLGTASSSFRQGSQRCIPTKHNKLRKSPPPKIVKASSVQKNDMAFPEGFKICEEGKENFNFLNSQQRVQFTKKPDCANFKFPSLLEPRESFSLKTDEEFPDSPIRRQTYTINTMLKSSRESEVLYFPPEKPFGNVSTPGKPFGNTLEGDWRRNPRPSTADNDDDYRSFLKIVHHPLVSKMSHDDDDDEYMNDSLEKCKEVPDDLDVSEQLRWEFGAPSLTGIPEETELASNESDFSEFCENVKRCSTFQAPSKCPVKKKKISPPRAKSSVASSNKQFPVKNSSVVSKPINGGVKKGKLLAKSMPKRALTLNKSRAIEPIVYHKNPYASMNIYYDEHWIVKREAAFTAWLNFILTPNDFSSEDVKVDSAKLWIESIKEISSVPAPTKEELSLKAFTAAKNLNALRQSAFSLYHSEDVVAVIRKIEKEVDLKKICVRKDRAIHADLGIKKDILEMLLSYNTLWLRIGLETIYGEVIVLHSNSDVLGLSRFIVHKFLHNPEVSSKYSHPAVINYYKKGYEDEMKRFTLKKFLLLVFFLDKAKNLHLIKHDPCLFNKNAPYKSSRDLLLVFSRDYLSGEGDVTKHLRYLGYKVTCEQSALEEFDFSVRNLSIDLRCGLRLGRVVELLLQDWTMFQKLRVNTINRLSKIHNNDVILKSLKNAGFEIENNIEAKHITDGDREKTLDLLWQIIFKTQIMKLIDTDFLKKEVAFLHSSLKLKADYAVYNALRKPDFTSDKQEISVMNSDLYKENELLQLLLEWCQTVCAHYDVRVHNFTSSFSDGRALCFLLHHYHPNIMPYESIKTETSSSYYEKQMEMEQSDENYPVYMRKDKSLIEKLLKNERENLTLVFQKFQEIGHIPILSCPADISNTLPDEKVMITLVAYINIRFMELCIEIRAARKVLHAWRTYRLRKQQEKLKKEIQAVKVIQKAWRNVLRKRRMKVENAAAVKIQSYWRMYCSKKELGRLKRQKEMERLNCSAILIQAVFRGFYVRKCLSRCHKAAVIIQTSFRGWAARCHFKRLRKATLIIQHRYRAKRICEMQRLKYTTLRQNVIKLQSYARGMLFRKCLKKQHLFAIKIQSYVRMWLVKRRYHKIRNACIVIQQQFRGHLLTEFYREEYQNHRSSAIAIQRWYRFQKYQLLRKQKAAVAIQSMYRMYSCRKRFTLMKKAVDTIERYRIGKVEREKYLDMKRSVVKLQSMFRCYAARKRYLEMKQSAVKLQSMFRCYAARKRYLEMKRSSVKIQSMFRCYAARKRYLEMKQSAVKLQSMFRRYAARKRYLKVKQTAVKLQSMFRRYTARKRYLEIKRSTVKLQSMFRCYAARKRYLEMKQSAVKLQSMFRCYAARKNYLEMKQSTVKLQSMFRCYAARKRYLEMKQSAVKLQSMLRCYLARKKYLKNKNSIIFIQACSRRFVQRKKYLKTKSAVVKIQRYYRAYTSMCSEREKYMLVRNGFIKLQAAFRGRCVRRNVEFLKKKAIIIQSTYRRWKAESKYKSLRQNCIVVQRRYRAKLEMKKEQQAFMCIRTAAIKIQALIRCYIAFKHYKSLRSSVIKVQSQIRMISCYRSYNRMKRAAETIQEFYRSFRQMKAVRNDYLHKRSLVIFLQSKVRSVNARKKFLKQKRSCIGIQSYFRMYIQRKKYVKIKNATVVIQRYFRNRQLMKKDQNAYQQNRKAIIYLQSRVKSAIARRLFLKQKNACISLQSYVRMYLQRKKYIKTHEAAICLQKHYRNWKAMKIQRSDYLLKQHAVIVLQSVFRSVLARKKFLKIKNATVVLQSYFRMYSCRRKLITKRNAAVTIQKYYLNWRVMKCEQNAYIKKKRAAIILQSMFRSTIARQMYLKQKNACISLQKYVRMYLQRKKYIKTREAAICLQKHYRNWKAMKMQRSSYLQKWHAAVILQSVFRSVLDRKRFLRLKNASIAIQSYFRMYSCRKKFTANRSAAITVQKYYRSWKLMKDEQNAFVRKKRAVVFLQSKFRSVLARKNYNKFRHACITIQSWFRMYLQKKRYHNVLQSTVFLQRHYRNMCLTKQTRNSFIEKRNAAIFLQSKIRCVTARRNFLKQKNACIVIQSFARMFIQRKKYQRILEAALVIQKSFRNYLLSTEVRRNYLNVHRACVTLQSYFRMYKCRKEFLSVRSSVVFIQNKYRAKLEARESRLHFLKLRTSCIKIQSYFRMVLAVNKLSKYCKACIVIQTNYRRYIARKKFKLYVDSMRYSSSCIKIQSIWRGYAVRKKMIARVQAVVKIQRLWRQRQMCKSMASLKKNETNLPRALFQHLWYLHLRRGVIHFQRAARAYLHRRCKAAVKIQAYWRAYLVRRSVTDEIVAARKKIKCADSSESKKLKNRTTRSLELLRDANLGSILLALEELDTCTKLSPRCCERLVASGGLTFLLRLVRSCNRSVPHMEIIKITINILLNLAKYERTVTSVWDESGSVDVILQCMKVFREKGVPIFTKCCSLLWIFSQDPAKAECMKTDVSLTDQLRRFHSLLSRKQSLEVKRQVASSRSQNPGALNKKLNRTILLQRGSLQIDPDWLLGSKRRREFDDPLFVLSWVMKCLDLNSK